jgi:predicted regulator of Ras-like GTPase activity (Roadblock/LC7/MglB family)
VAIDDALRELLDLSTQIREAVLLGSSGFVVASSTPPERGELLARVATEMLALARSVGEQHEVTRIEVADEAGGVFVIQDDGRVMVATTVPDATAALVVYDLRTALERAADGEQAAGV